MRDYLSCLHFDWHASLVVCDHTPGRLPPCIVTLLTRCKFGTFRWTNQIALVVAELLGFELDLWDAAKSLLHRATVLRRQRRQIHAWRLAH